MTPETRTTTIAALALTAQIYADPRPVYAAMRELFPDTDWSLWIALAEGAREKRQEAVHP